MAWNRFVLATLLFRTDYSTYNSTAERVDGCLPAPPSRRSGPRALGANPDRVHPSELE